jgi:hypothetical protein
MDLNGSISPIPYSCYYSHLGYLRFLIPTGSYTHVVSSQSLASQSVCNSFSSQNNTYLTCLNNQELTLRWVLSWTQRNRTYVGNGNCFRVVGDKSSTFCNISLWMEPFSYVNVTGDLLRTLSSGIKFILIWTCCSKSSLNVLRWYIFWLLLRLSSHKTLRLVN